MTNTYENEEFNKKTHHIKNIFFILSNIKKTQPSEGGRGVLYRVHIFRKKETIRAVSFSVCFDKSSELFLLNGWRVFTTTRRHPRQRLVVLVLVLVLAFAVG
jgi:hypothetical protein